jgi:hypothetical protein
MSIAASESPKALRSGLLKASLLLIAFCFRATNFALHAHILVHFSLPLPRPQARDSSLQFRIGFQALGFFQVAQGFGQTAGDTGERHAEVVLRVRVVRAEANRRFEMVYRFGLALGKVRERDAQVIVRLGIARVDAQGGFEFADGFGWIAGLEQGDAAVAVGLGRTASLGSGEQPWRKNFERCLVSKESRARHPRMARHSLTGLIANP